MNVIKIYVHYVKQIMIKIIICSIKIHYICNKHNEVYIYYCKDCNKNICSLCEKEHLNHDKLLISSMILDKNELIYNYNIIKILYYI